MNLGVILTDVTAGATTTLASFGAIFSLSIGLAFAVSVIKKFVRTR